jgi:hypothetical protein
LPVPKPGGYVRQRDRNFAGLPNLPRTGQIGIPADGKIGWTGVTDLEATIGRLWCARDLVS